MASRLLRSILAMALPAIHAMSQTLTLTPDSTALDPTGGTVLFRLELSFQGTATTDLEVKLPAGWTYFGGSDEPGTRPSAGASGRLTWSSATSLPSPIGFSFRASYPGGSPRGNVISSARLEQSGGITQVTLAPVAFGPPGAPTILIQPAGVFTTISSALAGFSVVAAGAPPLSYQWRKDGAAIPGATNSSFGYAQAAVAQSGRYDVVVSNSRGSIASDVAELTVSPINPNPGEAPPVIDVQPAQATAPAGGVAAFTVLAVSNYTLTYQWLRNGTPLPEALGPTLVLPAVRPEHAGQYSVIIRNAYGSVATRSATLAVGPSAGPGDPPVIVAAPASQVVPQGMTARLLVAATGSPPLSYQWLHYGVPIAGATAAILEVPTTTPSASGAYRAVVSNALGAATSPVATVTFVRGGVGLSGFGVIPNVRTIVGGSATFVAPAVGSPPLSYQWFKGEFPLPGATSAHLSFPQVIASDAGQYRVDLTNPWGTARYSGQLIVEAQAVEPSLVAHPTSVSPNAIDTAVTISALVEGTAPFTFQWLKNGRALPGATSVPLVLPALQPEEAGGYSLVVSNAAGTTTSSVYPLTVRGPGFSTLGTGPAGLPAILRQPQPSTVRGGATAVFSAAAVAEVPPVAYQWRKNGVALAGATEARLTLPQVSRADVADYSVVAWNSRGLAVSRAARLTVSGNSFAGAYFGRFVQKDVPSSSYPFCLYVRDDSTALYFGPFADGRQTVVDDAGRFSILQGATSGSIAGANAAFSLEGTITSGGDLSGTYHHPLSGYRAVLSAACSAVTGPTQSVAGLYRALSTDSAAARGSVVLDATGQAFVRWTDSERGDSGPGTVDANGRILASTSIYRMSGQVRSADTLLTLEVSPVAGGGSITFIGGREGRDDGERLVNLSTRATIGPAGTDPLIAGFVISSGEAQPVLVRAIGPTLADFGVANPLSAARLELFRSATPVASNAAWDPNSVSIAGLISSASQRIGAFALPRGSKDAVLLTALEPGAYTAHVSGASAASGNVLVEIYDATEGPPTGNQKLSNLATRALVGPGDRALVAGFVISGRLPKRVLLRGIGPGLDAFGLSGTLADPQLRLFAQDGSLLASNDDWGGSGNAALLRTRSAGLETGAFALNPGSKDAALVVNLLPGSYTLRLEGNGPTSGIALLEIYEVP